jgi:hypothetical protein
MKASRRTYALELLDPPSSRLPYGKHLAGQQKEENFSGNRSRTSLTRMLNDDKIKVASKFTLDNTVILQYRNFKNSDTVKIFNSSSSRSRSLAVDKKGISRGILPLDYLVV